MVRATYARTLIRLGGVIPAPWDETKITNLCTQADYIIDGYTYPETISTTSNVAIELAVDVVLRMMRMADLMQSSGGAVSADGRSYADLDPLSEPLKERIEALLRSSDYYGIVAIDTMEN